MKLRLWFTCAVLAAASAQAAPSLPGPAFPQFADPAALLARCEADVAELRRQVKALEQRPAGRGWLRAYDDLQAAIEDRGNPLMFLAHVHPQPPMRDAADRCEQQWQDFGSTLDQNRRLYAALRRVKPADAVDREFIQQIGQGMQDAGVALAGAARERAKQINDRMNELSQGFAKNIRDAGVRLAFTEAELQGVPVRVWQAAPRDEQGRVLLGVDMPTYVPLMELAESAATRERAWRAKTNEGGEANLALLGELARLRKEYAGLFGFRSYADFVLRRRMARSAGEATAFLDRVRAAVFERERAELQELRAAKSRHLGTALEATTLQRWDVNFYADRIRRERYAVDQESFRSYFPPRESLAFALRLIERLMGVTYTPVADAATWHPDVLAYAVSDTASGQALATLYVDLYPREGKYNHAAVWSMRNSREGGRAAQAALVVNLDRRGLTLDELETLLHELGHSVHNNLSMTRYAAQGGTSVLRDFVEAPSQMLEDWVYDRRVLDLFKTVCAACPPVPDEMLAKAKVAKQFPKGVFYSRQVLYASYDLALHDAEAPQPLALWQRLEGATPLGHVPGTIFPAGFGHLAGGYAAGYYGYLWSLVVAVDMRTAFAADRLDPQVGRRYRSAVLAQGAQKPPGRLVHDFLGRDFNADAFFEELKR